MVAERYGDAMHFLSVFNPDMQLRYSTDKDRCFRGKAPELGLVSRTYGADVAESWLMGQLHELGEYTGVRDKQTDRQKEDTAKVIIAEFGHLKVTEMMYFFVLLKSGRFGRFYGAVDAMAITSALREFLKIRDAELDRIIQAEQQTEHEREKALRKREVMTYEEYEELRWLFNMGYEPRHLQRY